MGNINVTQADRDAAADLLTCDLGEPLSPADKFQLESIRSGLDDDDDGVQAFARHRTASEQPASGEGMAQRLQDHMEQYHGVCLKASEWDAAVAVLLTTSEAPAQKDQQ